jgi:two-component system, LuxR family, response regulator TtrR
MRNDYKTEVTLYIVDDEMEARDSMVGLFGTGCGFRVQPFSSGEEFLRRVNIQKPDCVLLDRRMDGGMSGLEVHNALVAKSSPMVVLFLSGHGDIPTAMDARNNGAFDWLVKGMDTAKLQSKVVAAMKEAETRVVHQQQRIQVMARWDKLSPRPKEAARLIRKGWPSRLVADEMKIGVRVIDKYRSDIFETMWVNNPTELDRLMRDYDIQ